MTKICINQRFFGTYVYGYSVYSGTQIYDRSFDDYEGKSHTPSGINSNINSNLINPNQLSICRTFNVFSQRFIPTEINPVVGTNALNCNNAVGILTFKSYSRKGFICLEKGCAPNFCKVVCPGVEDGFCCIDRSLTDRLLQVLQN